MARVLAIEPFYGGSHRAFIDGLIERSRHKFQLLTQPPCFWKWRMRGAAVTMARRARESDFEPDLVFASDMLSLAEFTGLYPRRVPSILYMHENQLCYPAPQEDQRDLHFGFTNITSCLAADQVVWNSTFHMESFLQGLTPFLEMMPDQRPSGIDRRIREKSCVLYPGVDLAAIDRVPATREGPPIIIWNHRWEFDKKPETFFEAVDKLASSGLDFRVAVLGESFQARPDVFLEAEKRLGPRAARFGYVEDRQEYLGWLRRCSVSVSCAEQENFGIAAVEAACAGAVPIWPDRLSYPELIPGRRDHLYRDFGELVLKLEMAVKDAADGGPKGPFDPSLKRFDWSEVIDRYDRLIEAVAKGGSEV